MRSTACVVDASAGHRASAPDMWHRQDREAAAAAARAQEHDCISFAGHRGGPTQRIADTFAGSHHPSPFNNRV